MKTYAYYNTETGEYPCFEGTLYLRFPEISHEIEFFDVPAPYVRVMNTYDPFPEVDYAHKYHEDTPVYDSALGVWKRSFSVVDKTTEEIEFTLDKLKEKITKTKEDLLAKAAAYLTADKWENYDDNTRALWKTYKNDIMNVESQPNYPVDVTWPVMPEEPTDVVSCSPWQMRKILNSLGLRDQVETLITDSTDYNLKDGWKYATRFVSNDALVLTMGAALGKTEEEIKGLIQQASLL